MKRITILVLALLTLCGGVGCNASKTLTQGFSQAEAVSTELKAETGIKPQVGFNWFNGTLTSVTVSFPQFPKGKTFDEVADLTRQAVKKGFSQEPKQIALAFALSPNPALERTPTAGNAGSVGNTPRPQ